MSDDDLQDLIVSLKLKERAYSAKIDELNEIITRQEAIIQTRDKTIEGLRDTIRKDLSTFP